MAKSKKSSDIVKLIKEQSLPENDLRSFFDIETERLAVPRFRLCVFILIILMIVSNAADVLSNGNAVTHSFFRIRMAGAALLLFFGTLSFVPQFRKNCFAFTMMLALFVGSLAMLVQIALPSAAMDQMATYTLFIIMMGFLMPWGAGATVGICFALYLFYPLGFFLSKEHQDLQWFLRSNLYLAIYIVVAAVAARMNDSMRFKEFLQRKRMEGENTLLQDYQVRLKRAYERVENLAVVDTLTGAYNRSYFTRWLSNDIYKDKSCQDLFSVIMFDVDGFKTINDVAGHLQGDRILQLVTSKIKETIINRHLVFRYGGDEFCIILPSLDLPEAAKVSESLRSRIEKSPDMIVALPSRDSVHITISIGVTVASAATSIDADFLIKWVDAALLESKRQGRNCIHVFDPQDRKIKDVKSWQASRAR